ncbi:MAG: putative toxin-antitoxin system toxin component, PIN family [Acidobacteria bacterium]|nr:putative toxin-antitoxin system toxin component, PIN family [Acidobacteriota bacterium]
MRVFLDTNVLVAAFATRGLCADVLREVLTAHELLVGEAVLAELERALTRRLRLPASVVEEILQFLREHEVVPKSKAPAAFPIRDPADRWILASALEGHADVLITGDRDLLDIAQAPLRILDPRAFWELARRR